MGIKTKNKDRSRRAWGSDPDGAAPEKKVEWSKYQQAVFADFEDDAGHTVVEAVAGSGKTTTIVNGLDYVPDRRNVLLCAFNKSIQKELAAKAPGTTDVRTLHSIGFRLAAQTFGVSLDENKTKDIAKAVCIENGFSFEKKVNSHTTTIAVGAGKVAKLAGLAKNTLTGIDDAPALTDLAERFYLDDDPEKMPIEKLVEFTTTTLERCADQSKVIDFDDMIWFPAHFGWNPSRYAVVVVDETQDLNAAQLYLAKAMCKKGGRIVAVGDRFQSIYGFRGADSDAIPRMIGTLGAKVLPLSISYRCPRKVAELAREIVPHFEPAPGAIEGEIVRDVSDEQLIALASPGDMVLSRTKAPLLKACLRSLATGTPACVAGRDIGKRLAEVIRKSKASTVSQMNVWVSEWRDKEVGRLRDLERDEQAGEIVDTAETIFALSEGETGVGSVLNRISTLFRDDSPQSRVVYSTVHKAKGLERDRVFMMAPTFTVAHGRQEERNLYYVAVTRAKKQLFFVGGEVRR